MDRYRILIIDDEENTHDILGFYLQRDGFLVEHAWNGAEALDLLTGQVIDCILLDISMPGMDGFQTLEKIRSMRTTMDVPVLFLSSFNRENLIVKGLELGADDYITKPIQRAEVLARIKAALRRSIRYNRLNSALAGRLGELGLLELLQTFELGRKTVSITFPDMDACVVMREGLVVKAELGTHRQEEALQRMILVEKGQFSVEFQRAEEHADGNQLSLLAAVTAVDECREKLRDCTIDMDNTMMAVVEPDPDYPEFDVLPLKKMLSVTEVLIAIPGDVRTGAEKIIAARTSGTMTVQEP